MNIAWVLVLLLVAIGVTAAVVWILLSRRFQRQLSESTHQRDSLEQRCHQLLEENSQWGQRYAATQARLEQIDADRAHYDVAAEQRESVLELLYPLRDSVQTMQKRLHEAERERSAQHAQLAQALQDSASTDARIIESTQALRHTLHDRTARGYWGEVQLRRVVEAAGMLNRVDFSEQYSSSADASSARADGAGTLRPDMVVHLPGDRHLVIDAKTPLNPEDPALQAKALRARVNELAAKKYWAQVGLSPEVVFCFVPAESLLSAALDADPSLLDGSLARGVTLVTPASLLAGLKAVHAAWRHEQLAINIQAIVEHSRELYQRLVSLYGHLDKTGQRLQQAVSSYNSLLGALERRVLPHLDTMQQLELGEHLSSGASADAGSAASISAQNQQSSSQTATQYPSFQRSTLEVEVNSPGPRLQAGAADS